MKSAKEYHIYSIWVNRRITAYGTTFSIGKYAVPAEMTVDQSNYILATGAGVKERECCA